jgi:hypothetical protein
VPQTCHKTGHHGHVRTPQTRHYLRRNRTCQPVPPLPGGYPKRPRMGPLAYRPCRSGLYRSPAR